ncbi:MAG TPA: EamA/RhaT family transporter [Burkholderiales bacterium]|nr:EamA/RhaT family transporter [Burkholderiales bacterium]
MIAPDWLWIPVTIGAALAQTSRNAAQRHLTPILGTLGATLVRFLYGLPFALIWLGIVAFATGQPLPSANWSFAAWVVVSSVAQIGATALLLRVMHERNFALGTAYAKTEVIQIAVFGLVFLGDPITPTMMIAVAFGTVGVMLLAPIDRQKPVSTLIKGWTTRTALLGVASGAGFGLAATGYRGAALALPGTEFLMAAAYTLVAAQALQTVLLGGWLLVRSSSVVVRVLREWRRSLFAGLMGATASACWFTAMAIEPVAHVRTLALIEVFFGYVISHRFFRERVTGIEMAGMVLLVMGLVIVTLMR